MVLPVKIKVNMREEIPLLDAKRARFEFLSRQFKPMRGITSLTYNVMEMRPYPNTLIVTGVNAVGATVITVDHPEYAHTDQDIYNTRTKEHVTMNEVIGGVGTGGAITIVNRTGSGGLLKASAVGDILLIGTEVHAEGEAIPAAYSNQPTSRLTYLYQHDKTRKNTDIERLTAQYGPNQLLIDRIQFYVDEMKALALNLYHGNQGLEVVSAGGPRRMFMSGLMEQITTNVLDYDGIPGAMSLASLGEIARKTMDYSASADTKVVIAGQNAIAAISAMPAAAIQTTVSETSWGKALKTLVTPHANLAVEYDPMLSAKYGLADKLFVLDPNQIERLYLIGAETHMIMNVQANDDIHNQVDVITGTDGIFVGLEELSAYAEHVA